VIGYCSGGRHAVLSACRLPFDAAVDCYGAFVLAPPPSEVNLSVGPLDRDLPNLGCPLLGLFGADDRNPAPAEVAELEHRLTELGKDVTFHSYEDAVTLSLPSTGPPIVWLLPRTAGAGSPISSARTWGADRVHLRHRTRGPERLRPVVLHGSTSPGHRLLRPPGARRSITR
jgi:hypothetical protein